MTSELVVFWQLARETVKLIVVYCYKSHGAIVGIEQMAMSSFKFKFFLPCSGQSRLFFLLDRYPCFSPGKQLLFKDQLKR